MTGAPRTENEQTRSALATWMRLVSWEWVREMKRKDTIFSMILFSLITLFVFSRAITPDSESGQRHLAGILWVTFLMAGAIGIERSFRTGDKVLEGLLLSPIGRITIFYAKLASTFLFLLVMEVVIFAFFYILYNLRIGAGPVAALGGVVLITTVGYVAVGVTLSAMTRALHGGDVLLRILLFAFLIPILWTAVKITGDILESRPVEPGEIWLIVAFDLIFLGAGQLLFKPIMRDFDAS